MKLKIYLSVLLGLAFTGLAFGGPPTKTGHYWMLEKQKKEEQQQRAEKQAEWLKTTDQRASTVALNVGEKKEEKKHLNYHRRFKTGR